MACPKRQHKNRYPEFPPPSTGVVDKMEFASEEHVINALKTKLLECASAGCEVCISSFLKFGQLFGAHSWQTLKSSTDLRVASKEFSVRRVVVPAIGMF